MGLKLGLQMAAAISVQRLQVELDSQVVFNICQKASQIPHEVNAIWKDIQFHAKESVSDSGIWLEL
ncbi:hypothetical protein FRX31_010489 [Thalictrum thalictroides]|uniref:RNase H type-1 domain-containing protein n=1 Tax=Thalictrum thalictroides TaxID=46969 RepID=A0A7J6WRC4_THATH|nr:hypothetical protein FRX31_010489 [Thalictrum thalictroides]